jgi:hypothetical protein
LPTAAPPSVITFLMCSSVTDACQAESANVRGFGFSGPAPGPSPCPVVPWHV